MMEVKVSATPADLVSAVAAAFVERMLDLQAAGEVPHVVLTGGTIAVDLHEEIARLGVAEGLDFGGIEFWFGDERFLAPDSPDRNALQARGALLEKVGARRVHEMPSTASAATPDHGASLYEEELAGVGDFDLVFLGLGPDGHVASLMPGLPQLSVTDQDVVGVMDSPKPPPERISLTFPRLNRARSVWFIVSGDGKAEAVEKALAAEGSVEETPARGITTDDQTWWLDRGAAAFL